MAASEESMSSRHAKTVSLALVQGQSYGDYDLWLPSLTAPSQQVTVFTVYSLAALG